MNQEIVPLYDYKFSFENREKKIATLNALANVSSSVKMYHKMMIARDIKENLCKISLNKHEISNELGEYELPDGTIIKMGQERFLIPDLIFKQYNLQDPQNNNGLTPNSFDINSYYYDTSSSNMNAFQPNVNINTFKGLNKHVLEAINRCDMDLRKELLSNIVIVGGNSLMAGFVEKFEKSLYEIAPQNTKVKIFAYPKSFERKFSSWLGASI